MTTIYGEPVPDGTDSFTSRRRTGIGGSDAGAVLGVSPWRSRLGLYLEKRGLAPLEVPSERMTWGTRLERAVRDGYAQDYGRTVKHVGFRRHPSLPWVIGHPDASAGDRGLEVKVTGYLDARWGDEGSDKVPPMYYTQVQHYMALMDWPAVDIAVLVGGRSALRVYTVERDQMFLDALLDDEHAFWHDHVVAGVQPDPDGSDDAGAALRMLYPQGRPDEVVATPEVNVYVSDYLAARSIREAAQRKMDHASQMVQNYLGERSRLVGTGYTATWSNTPGNVSWKAVAADLSQYVPALDQARVFDDLTTKHRGEPSRRLTITEKSNDG